MSQTLDPRCAFPSGIRHVARIVDLLNSEHSSEEPQAVSLWQGGLGEARRLHPYSRSPVAPIQHIRLVLHSSAFLAVVNFALAIHYV
jgi:hypothetical protein